MGRKIYRLGEAIKFDGKMIGTIYRTKEFAGRNIQGRKTREFRPPKKGELYISGAIPMIWQAPNDLSTSFWIAELVEVKETITQTVSRLVGRSYYE